MRGQALRFRTVPIEQIYFKQFLCDDFKNSRYPLPENVRKARNTAIILGFVEAVCFLASFGYYDVRRSRVVLGLIIVTIVATIGGFYSKIRLSWWGLLLHACYTISIIGGFYIYIIVDMFLGSDTSSGDQGGRMSRTAVMVISSLPLFGLFVMGIYSCVLLIQIDEELTARKRALVAASGN